MSALTDLVAKLESSSSPNEGAVGGYVNYRYQQFPGFASQYGSGAAGVENYASQVLAANPNATFGDFYSGYVLNTGNPANLPGMAALADPSAYGYSSAVVSGARGAYSNLLSTGQADTPLSSLLGGGSDASIAPANGGSAADLGMGNQSDALAHTGLSSTSPTDPSMYPATSATTSITNNDQMFNVPDPNKVETTNIASSGILGQTQIAKSTGQVAQSTLQGDTTIAQAQTADTATAVSGLGDLFARGSLVVIGLLLLGGAFMFYYMQHKDNTFGIKAT